MNVEFWGAHSEMSTSSAVNDTSISHRFGRLTASNNQPTTTPTLSLTARHSLIPRLSCSAHFFTPTRCLSAFARLQRRSSSHMHATASKFPGARRPILVGSRKSARNTRTSPTSPRSGEARFGQTPYPDAVHRCQTRESHTMPILNLCPSLPLRHLKQPR